MPRGASPQGPEGLRSSSRSRSPTAQFQSHPQFQHPAAAVSRVLGALEAAGAGAGAGGGAGEALMQRGGGGAEGRPSAPPPPVLASPFARMQRQRSAEQLPREALAEGEVPWQPPPAVASASAPYLPRPSPCALNAPSHPLCLFTLRPCLSLLSSPLISSSPLPRRAILCSCAACGSVRFLRGVRGRLPGRRPPVGDRRARIERSCPASAGARASYPIFLVGQREAGPGVIGCQNPLLLRHGLSRSLPGRVSCWSLGLRLTPPRMAAHRLSPRVRSPCPLCSL